MMNFFYKVYLIIKFKKNGYPSNPLSILKDLHKSQYWKRTDMAEYQLNKLNKLIKESIQNTVYYNNLIFKKKDSFSNLNDFSEIFPEINKKDIIRKSDQLINHSINKRFKHTTSGSTGDPMIVEISGLAEAHRKAGLMRFKDWWDVKLNDRSVLIWGIKKTEVQPSSYVYRIKQKLRNRLDIDVFDLNDKTIGTYVDRVEKFKPKFIRGYKSGVYMFARLMDKHNLKFKNSRLKVIIVTSEILFDNERKYIESILKCKVANEYGAAETGFNAYECPEGSMHINEESVFIHTDKENKARVTELFNNSMPLINYKNDDRLFISNDYCSCGRTLRIIEKIEGRVNDVVICPDGTEKSQYIFYYIIKELDDIGLEKSIVKYKIIQNKFLFTILIIPDSNYCDEVENYIRKRLYEEIGCNIEIDLKIVDQIPFEKSGKLRFFKREQ